MKKLLINYIEEYCYDLLKSKLKPLIINKEKYFDKIFNQKQNNKEELPVIQKINNDIKELKEKYKSSISKTEKKTIKNNLELLEIAKQNSDKIKFN